MYVQYITRLSKAVFYKLKLSFLLLTWQFFNKILTIIIIIDKKLTVLAKKTIMIIAKKE